MDWQSQFKAEFFRQWRLADLPAPEPHVDAYRAWLRSSVPPRLGRRSTSGPLDAALLGTVYGFGTFIGDLAGHLLGVREPSRTRRADWCGRFNLGISLFDYVCDEAHGARRVLSLPAFRAFVARVPGLPAGLRADEGEVERALDQVAAGVLRDLAAEIGPDPAHGRSRGLWRAMHALFLAQMTSLGAGGAAIAHAGDSMRASRAKSVEPFRVMSEWMVLGGRSDVHRQARARTLGRAIGTVVWIVDDAKDVWRDLEAGRPNLFLTRAAAAEPALARQRVGHERDGLFDSRLVQALERTRAAHVVCRRAIGRLRSALVDSRLSGPRRTLLLGRLGAALACW